MEKKRVLSLTRALISSLLLAGSPLRAWNSPFLQPAGGGAWAEPVVNAGGRDFRLDNHSYTGYKLSERGLRDGVPTRVIDLVAANGDDIGAALQSAVNALGGTGGVVRIPAGTFILSTTVLVESDNILILGAGSELTTLTVSSAYNPLSNLIEAPITFTVRGTGNWPLWPQAGRALVQTAVTADVVREATAVSVASAAGLAAGDWVVLQQFLWTQFVQDNSGGVWPTAPSASASSYAFSFTYLRKVAAVAGGVVTLDAPVPRPMRLSDHPVALFKPSPDEYTENVGLEGVTFRVQPNANNEDEPGRPAGSAVQFKGVFNGWTRDVKVFNAARFGFNTAWSARMTHLDCEVDGVQDRGGNGYGYAFYGQASQQVLYKRCRASNTRHNFIVRGTMTSGVVWSRCLSEKVPDAADSFEDDTHHSYAHHLLWDVHSLAGGVGLAGWNRGWESADAHETFGGGAVWNLLTDGRTSATSPVAGKVLISPALDADAIVVGVRGNGSGIHTVHDGGSWIPQTWGTLMSGAALQRGPRGNVAYEGLGLGGVEPESLFEAQLFTRLGGVLPPEVTPGIPPPADVTPPASPRNLAVR